MRRRPRSPLFPYTTLFRSCRIRPHQRADCSKSPVTCVLQEFRGALRVCGITVARCQLILRSEEHTSELQSQFHLVCRLLLEKKKNSRTCARWSASTRCSTV